MSTSAHVSLDPVAAVRWIDVVLVAAAAPFVVLMGLPVLGYVVGATGWIVSRLIGYGIERRAKASDNIRIQTGLTLFGSLGRAWLVGLTILVAGLTAEREDGLMAAVLVLVAFTIYLICSIALRPTQRKSTQS